MSSPTPTAANGGLDFSKTRSELLEARHLPGAFYTSPELFQREIDTIFMKEWICVGRVEQFPEVGDYRALRIANEPLLICKNRMGELRAFSNVCRHRGVEVIQGTGNTAEFQCPYHAWIYDLDGALQGAPFRKEVKGFEWDACRLPALRLETWAGYVFVNFDPQAERLEDYLAADQVQKKAAFLRAEDTFVGDEYTFEVDCNWKFIPENLMDMYHVGVIHGSSFGAHFPVQKFPYQLTRYGYHAEYESLTMAPGGEWLFGKAMPWLEHKPKHFAFTVFIRPTFNLFARPDLLQPWFCHPVSPDRTRITILTQYPKEWFEQPAFEEKNRLIADFIRLVADEDREMLLSLQNGVGSRAFRPGPTVKLERAIHHLLNTYLDRMFGEDTTATENPHG